MSNKITNKDLDLKPCPFCGWEAQLYQTEPDDSGRVKYYVHCLNEKCHIRTWGSGSKQEAIDVWQHRNYHDVF